MGNSNQSSNHKDLYVELGTNFRHFLAWRRFLFAGYFGVIAGLGAAFEWANSGASMLNRALLIVAAFISIVFWLLDVRNRQMIRIASKAGANLEDKLGVADIGLFSTYENGPVQLSHTKILSVFYWGATIFFVVWFLSY